MNTAPINGSQIDGAPSFAGAPRHTVFLSTGTRRGLDRTRSTAAERAAVAAAFGSTGTRRGLDRTRSTARGR